MLRLGALLAALALLGGCAASRCGPESVVILARHADRVEGTDSLTPAGVRRSQELAHALGKAGVTAIVTSDVILICCSIVDSCRYVGLW